MERRVSSPKGYRRHRPTVAALSLLIAVDVATAVADTDLYRCVAPDGKVEFRQTVCAGDAGQEEVRVKDRMTGWEPPKPKLEESEKDSERSSRSEGNSKKDDADRDRQEKQCWKKRQQLDEVNWKLRHGYKPAAGVKLRRRREEYEDYIRRFCK
jgi:hypothetical protein